MATNTMIYKYPKIKAFVDANCSDINPIYLDKHFNLVEYARHNNVNSFYFSQKSSDEAIDMMINNPALVNFNIIFYNINPRIRFILDWRTNFDPIEWSNMSASHNPYIMELLEKNLDKIDWTTLSRNEYEGAINILKKHQDKINWYIIMRNPSAIEIMKEHPEKIIWNSEGFNVNPNAIELIKEMAKKDLTKINFTALSINPNAIPILSKHLDKIDWYYLSYNPNAISILMEHPEKISLDNFLRNPNAIPHIETIMEKMQIEYLHIYQLKNLTLNKNSIPLIQKWWDEGKISTKNMKELIFNLQYNTSVFDCCDFKEMSKERTRLIYTELISKALHPLRIDKWLQYHIENGGDITDFDYI